MPKVSVVVPVYNAQNYVEKCLISLKKQTLEDYEVVIVDDGSTDSSKEICERFCENDSRFRCIHQDNSGPDIARKTGTNNASGEYLMYVDADDYVSERYLEHSVEAAQEYGADMVCSQIIRFNGDKTWPGSKHTEDTIIYSDVRDALNAFFVDEYLKGTYYAKLIKAYIMKEYSFVKDAVIGEDISAALYMINKSARIAVIPEEDYFYFWNPHSISHSGYSKRHRVSLENYIKVRDSILKGGYVDEKVVCGYFAEYEMAVATAMSRSWTYDNKAGELLKLDIAKYWKQIKANDKTPLYMKICMQIYLISPKLFMFLYRIIYLITGR